MLKGLSTYKVNGKSDEYRMENKIYEVGTGVSLILRGQEGRLQLLGSTC